MFRFILFAIFVGSAAGAIYNVVFENAHYRGHFISVNGSAQGFAAIRNPPVSRESSWVMDWDLMFRAQGSTIRSSFSPFLMSTTPVDSATPAPLVLSGTGSPWKMSYRVDSTKYLYKIEMLAPTGGAVLGCLFDDGRFPIVTSAANCTNDQLRAWWNIYTV